MYFVLYKINMTKSNILVSHPFSQPSHLKKKKKRWQIEWCDHICSHFECSQANSLCCNGAWCCSIPIQQMQYFSNFSNISTIAIVLLLFISKMSPSPRQSSLLLSEYLNISIPYSLVGSSELPPTEINQICIIFSNQTFRSPFLSLFPVFIATSSC